MATRALGPVRRSFAPWNDPTAVPLIRFDKVTKRFGGFTAVDDLTLDIHEREFFALLGPSGCGKTTLMRMLAGFEEPTEGRITLGGEDMAGRPPYRRPTNMMFQSYALFPHMTVEGNIAFGLKQDGMTKGEIASRVEEMLKLTRLESFAKRKPHQLSGGQRQRVALARSLAKKPKVLLLDEPLGALDKKLRQDTQFELMDIQVTLGLTFLIVTHDQEEAMTVADRVAVMDKGKLIQVATPGEIYEQPNSRYVADFIGDINIIEGRITGASGGRVTIGSAEAEAPLTVASEADLAKDTTAWIAVRPEKTRLSLDAPPAGTANALTGTIFDIAYLGDWTVYLVQLPGGKILRVSQANMTRTVERPISWDDKVHLWWAPEAGVLLSR
ncbi:polyamine-transporting ATPase [Agaricicola taiwanensis]|uniref:Spermidine/putrescine import ATP-binding protein PotA n=1 Tax=Agaricicola taiwanensis TaxID=591372 RepID=A0A8J2VQZ4_9RHOB|nr:ABC transporter ATP-binding protein [Agaricicola taiwanensis]GGE33928.1 polyamine-transporting ATPase [Agaricicola taiwanensis]